MDKAFDILKICNNNCCIGLFFRFYFRRGFFNKNSWTSRRKISTLWNKTFTFKIDNALVILNTSDVVDVNKGNLH